MPRLTIIAVLVAAILAVAAPAGAAEGRPTDQAKPAAVRTDPPIDQTVRLFNPALLHANNYSELPGMETMFTAPASDVARAVKANAWFTLLVFLPFLVLPIVLLLIVMFRFRDRGDGRKPATFMHNARLENIWTAIPILTLFIVAVPVYPLLYRLESPAPKTDIPILVTGKTFAWDYQYQREDVSIGQDPVSGIQEPLVLVVDKTVSLNMTSNDVNHAWWIPAFGVKKDCIRGRYNHAWFTPDRLGFYKGQCAELCGQDHGMMVIDSVVVEAEQFALYLDLQRNRNDTVKVWTAFGPQQNAVTAPDQIKPVIAKYLDNEKKLPHRAYALRYWIASNCVSFERRPPDRGQKAEELASYPPRYQQWKKDCAALPAKRAAFDKLLDAIVAEREQADRQTIADATPAPIGGTP